MDFIWGLFLCFSGSRCFTRCASSLVWLAKLAALIRKSTLAWIEGNNETSPDDWKVGSFIKMIPTLFPLQFEWCKSENPAWPGDSARRLFEATIMSFVFSVRSFNFPPFFAPRSSLWLSFHKVMFASLSRQIWIRFTVHFINTLPLDCSSCWFWPRNTEVDPCGWVVVEWGRDHCGTTNCGAAKYFWVHPSSSQRNRSISHASWISMRKRLA